MPNLFLSPQQEISTLQSHRERRNRIQAITSTVTPVHAALIAQYGRVAPTTDPGLVRSLAQSDIPPTHPIAQFAITQSQYRSMVERGGWDRDPQQRVISQPFAWSQSATDYYTKNAQTALTAAEDLGLIHDGVLVEPSDDLSSDSDEWRAFNRIKKAFTSLSQPLPYVTNSGAPVQFYPTNAASQPGPKAAIHKQDTGTLEYLSQDTPESSSGFLGDIMDFAAQQSAPVSELLNIPSMERGGLPELSLQGLNTAIETTSAPVRQSSFFPQTASPKAQLRSTFMAFDAPVQELQGQVRNVYASLHGESPNYLESQSDFGVMMSGNYGLEDSGAGILLDPESAIARERRRREAERGQIGGHNITLGRWIASPLEPDTAPFRIVSGLVDAGVQVADPTAFGMGKVGKARFGLPARLVGREFQPDAAAGIFSGIRNYFDGPTFSRWLDNNTSLIDTFAATSDPYDIARLTNFKLDPSLTRALSATSDPTNIAGILRGAVERGAVRQTTDITGTVPSRMARSWEDNLRELRPSYNPRAIRLLKPMPGTTLDLTDSRQVANNLINVLHNAHASESEIRAVYNRVANSKTRNGLLSAVDAAQGSVGNMLRHYGIENDELIANLTSINRHTQTSHLSGLVNDIGQDVPIWEDLTLDGTSQLTPGPHLPTEHLSRFIHLPDQRAIRRLTSRYSNIFARQTEEAIGKPRLPFALVDSFTSQVLKPLWLLRLAWPVRVIGEEQIRMATAGLDSAFSGHPVSWLSFAIGSKQTRLEKLLATVPGVKASSNLTASGLMFDELEQFNKAVRNTHRAWLDRPGSIPTSHKTLYDRTVSDELSDFRYAWADELSTLHQDPVSNYISQHSFDESVQWLDKGAGRGYKNELMEAHPGNLSDPDSIRRYVQTVSDRITWMTNGDTDLLTIIKTGKFNGEPISTGGLNQLNPNFTRHLSSHIDSAPTKIKGNAWTRRSSKGEFKGAWDEFTDRMFGGLMGSPTATLSRAPAFKQYYWKHVADLLPYADDTAKATALRFASESNLPTRTIRNLERQSARASGKLSIIELEDLAKGYALDDTKTLLYDISEKGQVSDILRNIIPFGEAWREVIGRWAKLTLQTGGKPVRRAQQLIQGARGEEFGELMGAPEDKGFFYKNEFGEEVFAYPGSQWLMNQEFGIPHTPFNLPGMPVPLTGRVQGLNMFGSILPSLGPVASIPVAWFLQDKPQYDWWKEQLLPFGGPGAEETSDIFELQQYLPTWGKTAVDWLTKGGTNDRIYNSSVMYVASYLYSTGEYGNTIEEQQRLMEDARSKTQDVYFIRAIGQFMLPASPSPSWLIKDKSGHLLSQRILAEEYYDILDQSQDYDQATQLFLQRYGTEAIGAIIPHSSSIIPNVPTSLEAAQWAATHPDIKSSFPLTYALFAPDGEFDIETYLHNFITNERDALTPEQWAALRDNTLANYWYNYQKSRLGADINSPTKPQSEWLRARKSEIQAAYPYWGDRTGRAEKPDIEVLIRDLYRTAQDPLLSDTNAGKALTQYLTYRDKTIELATANDYSPTSFRTAQAFAPTRSWLRDKAEQLIRRYPEFQPIWDYVFDRELGLDIEDAQTNP